MRKTFSWRAACLFAFGLGLAPALASAADSAARPSKDKAVREMKPAECDRNFPDKALCPPQSVPADRKCENLARDISGQSGLTGYVYEQKKTDMRKQYDLMCARDRGSEYECEHLGRDLAGSTGAARGFAAETRKQDLRWIYDRRCTDGGSRQQVVVPAIIVR
jgi:hypothetical protein